MFKTLFLFCQIVSELDIENLPKPETLQQYQASAVKETEKIERGKKLKRGKKRKARKPKRKSKKLKKSS